MNEMVVETPAQLAAAFTAGACPTHSEAGQNPFRVRLGTAVYTFNAGLPEARAATLAATARRMYRAK